MKSSLRGAAPNCARPSCGALDMLPLAGDSLGRDEMVPSIKVGALLRRNEKVHLCFRTQLIHSPAK